MIIGGSINEKFEWLDDFAWEKLENGNKNWDKLLHFYSQKFVLLENIGITIYINFIFTLHISNRDISNYIIVESNF